MKKFSIALLLAAVLCVPAFTAHAEETDMSKVTCKDFLADKENMPMMLLWIDGYMSGKSDNTVINEEWMAKLGAHMGSFCGQNPTKTVMEAMDAMK